jgi:hypothetical protein
VIKDTVAGIGYLTETVETVSMRRLVSAPTMFVLNFCSDIRFSARRSENTEKAK